MAGDTEQSISAKNNEYRDTYVSPDDWLRDDIDDRPYAATLPALNTLRIERLVAVIAEPGMGKSFLTLLAQREAEESQIKVYRYEMDKTTDEQACRKIVRCSREVCKRVRRERGVLVIFDGIVPPDEVEAAAEGRAIMRLVEAGARVLVCVRPESQQVVECLNNPVCLTVENLIVPASQLDERCEGMTGGIPALVAACNSDIGDDDELVDPLGRRYLEVLEDLIRKTIRQGQPLEEQRVRFAMMLLGEGTLDEVSVVSGRCDIEQLQWLERDAPLFGVDANKGVFVCHGLSRDDVYAACEPALRGFAAEFPQLIVRACSVLAAREDTRRSVLTSRLCASEDDLMSICVKWGVPYASIGDTKVVEGALRRAEIVGATHDARVVLSRAAVDALTGTAAKVDESWTQLERLQVTSSYDARLHRQVLLLGACRDVLRNPQRASKYLETDPLDSLGLSCLDHLRLVRLLTRGSFEEAYALAPNQMPAREPQSIPDALVCEDVMIALVMSGGVPDLKEQHLFDCARNFLARSGLRRLYGYHEAIENALEVVMGSCVSTDSIEEAVAWAERAGDGFFQAVCLFACSVADLRMRAYSRAHVRAQKATNAAQTLCEGYLSAASRLVDAIAREALGEADSLARFCDTPGLAEGMSLIAHVAANATYMGERRPLEIPNALPLPQDSLWVLNVFANDCPELWARMANVLPSTWAELLRAVHARQSEMFTPREEQPVRALPAPVAESASALGEGGQAELPIPVEKGAKVRVSVLGGLLIEVAGETPPEGLLERRRARDLIALLAMAPGHKLRRYQAVEVLWGNDDYYKGLRKLYEATGEARKRLGEFCGGENIILTDRTQGAIGFDMGLVSCDIDDFEREARMALAENGDDFWVLGHGRRMMQLFSSGPDEHVGALGQLVADRAQELKTLYVDGVIATGEAAMRLGKAKLAVRCAMDAHHIDYLREDAMILLVRALKAAGRAYEVAEWYRRYSRRLIEARGMPPSLALRRIVEIILQDEPGAPTP